MIDEQKSCIQPHHRSCLAIVYIPPAIGPGAPSDHRQLHHEYAQEEHPWRWGWQQDMVTVLDEDLDWTGPAADRPGFQRLGRMIAEGCVGLVCVAALCHLSRSRTMLLAFLQACRHAGTLVAVNGRLIDLARFPANDYTQRLYQLTAAYYRDLTHLFEEVDRLLEDSD